MMYNNSFFRIILIIISVAFLSSCDKDFNSVGGDLIGDEHFGLEQKSFDVVSYNQKVDAVQSNNMPFNALGIYEDAVFGTTEASFVTQVALASTSLAPTIGANAVIDNVVLYIPYLSHVDKTDATTGDNTYVLDSIYGNENGKIKLSVFENGYYLRDLDPATGFLEPQKYYSDQKSDFDGLIKSARLNDTIHSPQNDEFFFDNKEFKVETAATTEAAATVTRTPPGMRLALNKAYFKTKIIDAVASGKLASNDVFKDYFRGLYFKVEKSGANASRLAVMNFSGGTITINFKEDSSTDSTVKVKRSIVLNLTGNTVSLLSNNLTNAAGYTSATGNANDVSGDDKLYLKGGEGALSVLNLFDKADVLGYDANGVLTGPNGVPDQLDELRRKDPATGRKKLINEANLVFHVDGATMGANKTPSRLYLYDFTNSRMIVDFPYIAAQGATDLTGLGIYGGALNTTNPLDKTYKIRITNHVRNLVNNSDSTNVKLGVVVGWDINNIAMNKTKAATPKLSKAPQMSLMGPAGVVLFGGTAAVPEAKRLKLEIYYTKPN